MRLVFSYLFNAHLFDLKYKTDTHSLVPLASMRSTSENLSHSLMYMVSWTSTLKKSFIKVQSHFNLAGFDFIDLGSGKGKATLLARKIELLGNSERYFGIDFEKSLVEIAEKNSNQMFGDKGHFYHQDVVKIGWERFSQEIMIFMYNPFNSIVLRQVLASIENKRVIILYVNPVESQTILDNGYEIFHSFKGWHANLTYMVFTKNVAEKEG